MTLTNIHTSPRPLREGNPWTPERTEDLRRWWADGFSATEVAKKLDCGIGRNAVIGKVHRMGLPKRRAGRKLKERGPDAPRPRRIRAAAPPRPKAPAAPRVRRPAPVVLVAVPPPPPPESRNLTIMDLSDHTCRWPVNDERPFLFCGVEPAKVGVYCEYHRRIAYTAPEKRTNRPDGFKLAPMLGRKFEAAAA